MLRVNLLPGRTSKRSEHARNELIVAAVLVVASLIFVYSWGSGQDDEQRQLKKKIAALNTEIAQIKKDVARVDQYKQQADALQKKIGVIESLTSKKTGPARLLDDLAVILTDEPKVWLTGFENTGGKIRLTGGAMEYEKISEFQIAIEKRSKFFSGVQLHSVNTDKLKDTTYFSWEITCKADLGSAG